MIDMRRCLLILTLCIPLCSYAQFRTPAYSELSESEVVRAMKEDVAYLASAALEGRAAGSEGELEAARYMSSRFSECGLDLLYGPDGDLFGMRRDEKGDTLVSRNVAACISGYDKKLKNNYIVVVARLDNLGTSEIPVDGVRESRTYYGANGNASGLAMLIQLADRLNTNRVLLKRSVILLAAGASVPDGAGSWYFLNRSFSGTPAIDAMVELNMLGTASGGFYAYTASNEDMNRTVASVSSTLQPIQPDIVTIEPCNSDHRIFYAEGIPSVFFTTGMYPEYNTEKDTPHILEYDNMERELEYIYNCIVSLACGDKPEFNPAESVKNSYNAARSGVVPYYECDVRPSFLGSSNPADFLRRWVYVYLKYPREAVNQGIQGRVLVDFVIDEKGKVTSVEAVKSSHPLLEEEALRVIKASPDWKPGRVRGKKVKSQVSLNVEFRLEKKK